MRGSVKVRGRCPYPYMSSKINISASTMTWPGARMLKAGNWATQLLEAPSALRYMRERNLYVYGAEARWPSEMSTYILMKILEHVPASYDRRIRAITLGGLDKAYDRLTSHVEEGQRVLDLGCGTGALTLRAARRGAKVMGIDINPQMLDGARKRIAEGNLGSNIELREMGIAELGSESPESYDVVMAGLCFSELTEDELLYALKQVKVILRPGGLLLIADETRPQGVPRLLAHWLIRFPLVVLTYVIAGTRTTAVRNLPERIEAAGLVVESVRLSKMQNFIELVAIKPGG